MVPGVDGSVESYDRDVVIAASGKRDPDCNLGSKAADVSVQVSGCSPPPQEESRDRMSYLCVPFCQICVFPAPLATSTVPIVKRLNIATFSDPLTWAKLDWQLELLTHSRFF